MAVVLGPNTSVLSSPFSVTASVGTFQDTGLSVAVPPQSLEGQHDFCAYVDVRGNLNPVSGSGDSWMTVKVVADDGSSPYDVPDSERLLLFVGQTQVDGNQHQSQESFTVPFTLSDPSLATTLHLHVLVGGCSSGVNFARIESNNDGRTIMSIVQNVN